ncbi:minor extracellular protease vpr [Paraliobacillus quinghaiensis]|uniref:Minor extracellular protease vpr n=1 Tax=Paraliobacillus quinghaiensis TaxID=470815 RepID=A0A917WVN5_9BACI|nr:S8 family serine peptidase [Paraliobacillus quinghaiensis]GGM32638.1 minor extracellular protease vpr [Paraliobacillus quinghaiensis]
MRTFLLIITIMLILPLIPVDAADRLDDHSIIIEVDGDPHQQKEYLKTYQPNIEVLEVFDTLFQGLALRGKQHQLKRLGEFDFVKNTYPVHTYQTNKETPINQSVPFLLKDGGKTDTQSFTGKGVKVGVIDTGIDYTHPDLEKNYQGGFDLVDYDDDPMETTIEQGPPTIHGTHVAGIIAANGKMKGIAPDADLYAYRALGPGGAGTSVQVMAALERAVKDGMDIINMSLGNTINGPDWPTSVAVNRAVEHGVSMVIANGNSGPANWTVGSPATATKAIGVGASTPIITTPIIVDHFEEKEIALTPLIGTNEWDLNRKFQLVDGGIGDKPIPNARGKIVLMKRGKISFTEKVQQAEAQGARAVLIYNNEEGPFQGGLEATTTIPAATISQENGEWLFNQTKKQKYWLETTYVTSQDLMADFSSRGPVTANWNIKPEIVAPGAGITSTIPGGYQTLQGTSMAAPHIAGALAVLKEAHPDWSPEQLKGALLTQALPLEHGDKRYEPIDQGMGRVQLDKAINTDTIITNPLLAFGKIDTNKEIQKVQFEIENVSEKKQTFSIDLPDQTKGLRWYTPRTIAVKPGETKAISVGLGVTSRQLAEGLHQGWLLLKGSNQTFSLPYLFVNQTADFPKAAGFELALDQYNKDNYRYSLYVTEPAKEIKVDLYDPDTMVFVQTILNLEEHSVGVVEGDLPVKNLPNQGQYIANIIVVATNGNTFHQQASILIE